MSWIGRFFRHEASEPGVVTPSSVRFDTTGCRVENRAIGRIEWRDLDGDSIVASVESFEKKSRWGES